GIERPAWAARERDQAFGLTRKRGELDVRRLVRGRTEERARIEPHQAAVAALARCKEDEARPHRGRAASARGLLIAEIDRKRAADDGLNAAARELFGKFQPTEHVAALRDPHRG